MSAQPEIPFTTEPYTQNMHITPEIAARWLEHNHKNRRPRRGVVDTYARDMLDGQWMLTGESIKWSAASGGGVQDQILLDGQHRLWAIVKSGVSILTAVTFNISREAQAAMDSGVQRTASDALGYQDERHTSVLASIARLVVSIDRGGYEAAASMGKVSHAQIIGAIETNPGLREAAAFASAVARRTDVVAAIVGYTYWRMCQVDPVKAREFWTLAASKVGLSTNSPILALTNRMAEARRNRQQLPRNIVISAVFRAWNAWRDGKTLTVLRTKSPAGGVVPVPEPK